MKNCVVATLGDLVDRLDARAWVRVLSVKNDILFVGKVCELITTETPRFMVEYSLRKVTALTVTDNYVNVILEEGEE